MRRNGERAGQLTGSRGGLDGAIAERDAVSHGCRGALQRMLPQREQRQRGFPPGNAEVEAPSALRRDSQDGVEIDRPFAQGLIPVVRLHPLHADAGASRCFLHYLYGQAGRIPVIIRADVRDEISVAGAQRDGWLAAGKRERPNYQRKGGADANSCVILRTAQTISAPRESYRQAGRVSIIAILAPAACLMPL